MSATFEIKHYRDLTLDEFHDIISLRIEIFSVEQEVFYNDLDGYDKNCHHVICKNKEGEIIGTARMLPPKLKYSESSFGRVVIKKSERGTGLGHEMVKLMNEFLLTSYPNANIKISAMLYLKDFYESHGYQKSSDIYLDCGIEHIDMDYSQ